MDDDLFSDLMESADEALSMQAVWASVVDPTTDPRVRYVPAPEPFRVGRDECHGVYVLVGYEAEWLWREESSVKTTWSNPESAGESTHLVPRHLTGYRIYKTPDPDGHEA